LKAIVDITQFRYSGNWKNFVYAVENGWYDAIEFVGICWYKTGENTSAVFGEGHEQFCYRFL